MSNERIFGTDGVRGVANEGLTAKFALELGTAAGYWTRTHPQKFEQKLELKPEQQNAGKNSAARRPVVVIGRDTRLSGDMLEAALAAGLASAGIDVVNVGIVPTPAVAQIALALGAAAGVVISASHNPFEDNGIKFFGPDGRKLPDRVEDEIEAILYRLDSLPRPTGGAIGKIVYDRSAVSHYIESVIASITRGDSTADARTDRSFLNDRKSSLTANTKPLTGLRLAADCANGAAYELAPQILRLLGAEVFPQNDTPDGVNINVDCGSTHPKAMADYVRTLGDGTIGLAFDGDADRVMLADENGSIVDGDRMMAIIALHLHAQGRLPGNVVVATIMSNVGLEQALGAQGIRLYRTDVGDRYVAEAMETLGAAVGGEQSGHILLPFITPTGDGLVTALQVLAVMHATRKPLCELASVVQTGPQLLKNVRVRSKQGWREDLDIQQAIADGQQRLGSAEWLSVRPSGTEPLIRVMAQGTDSATVETVVHDICAVVERKLGAAV